MEITVDRPERTEPHDTEAVAALALRQAAQEAYAKGGYGVSYAGEDPTMPDKPVKSSYPNYPA